MTDNRRQVIQIATQLYERGPDWVTFFREVLGLEGIVRRIYPSAEELAAFEKTEEYAKIQTMVETLRRNGEEDAATKEATRVVTVRLPQCLHESLKAEAHDRNTSMNHLCISKLLKALEAEVQLQQPGLAPAKA